MFPAVDERDYTIRVYMLYLNDVTSCHSLPEYVLYAVSRSYSATNSYILFYLP